MALSVILTSGCNADESNNEGAYIPPKILEISRAKARHDKGFIQKGFYRVVTQDVNAFYFQRPGDPNRYGRPSLNYEELPDIEGNTMAMTLKTNAGEIKAEYQFCLYYDSYNEFDPNSDPNILMNWVIEKVDKVVPVPVIDMSSFYWGDYYVMQCKFKVPPNCKPLDSFADWLPNNVGIFMEKYAQKNGTVYYVSNPILFTMYKEMAGTYIGNNEIHSYIPQGNDPNVIHTHYDEFYHPLNDITKDICIEEHCYKHYYHLFSCDKL